MTTLVSNDKCALVVDLENFDWNLGPISCLLLEGDRARGTLVILG